MPHIHINHYPSPIGMTLILTAVLFVASDFPCVNACPPLIHLWILILDMDRVPAVYCFAHT